MSEEYMYEPVKVLVPDIHLHSPLLKPNCDTHLQHSLADGVRAL